MGLSVTVGVIIMLTSTPRSVAAQLPLSLSLPLPTRMPTTSQPKQIPKRAPTPLREQRSQRVRPRIVVHVALDVGRRAGGVGRGGKGEVVEVVVMEGGGYAGAAGGRAHAVGEVGLC